jgi:hypothetical protein
LSKQDAAEVYVKLGTRDEPVRLAFAQNLFKKGQVNGEGKPRFSAAALFKKGSAAYKALNAAIVKAAELKWGVESVTIQTEEGPKKMTKGASIARALGAQDKLCMHNGDTKPNYEDFPGNYFVNANSQSLPLILHANPKNPDNTDNIIHEEDGVIYGGCYVVMHVKVWAQDNKWGKRVNAQLAGVQFVKDGEAFSAGTPARSDEFEDLSGADDAPAATSTDDSDDLV